MSQYVLLKRGLYWRLHSCGYTGLLSEAESYTEEELPIYLGDGTTSMLRSEAPEIAPSCALDVQVRYWRLKAEGLQRRVLYLEAQARKP